MDWLVPDGCGAGTPVTAVALVNVTSPVFGVRLSSIIFSLDIRRSYSDAVPTEPSAPVAVHITTAEFRVEDPD